MEKNYNPMESVTEKVGGVAAYPDPLVPTPMA